MNIKPKVSVIIIARNEEKYITHCINSIMNQDFKNFELLIIDDYSNDRTLDIILSFTDSRIKVIRNESILGPVESRNRGIKHSCGKHIFFTDGDCYPKNNWISEGIATFKKTKCSGVEGCIILTAKTGSIRDKDVENLSGNEYMSGNIAYTREILEKVGGFSNDFRHYYEDREMAFRVLKQGKIIFNEGMEVRHQLKSWNIKGFFLNARKAEGLVLLYKKYGWDYYISLRIIKPREFILIFLPFLIFYPIFRGKIKTFGELIYLPLIYFRAIYMRLIIWRTSLREGVFLI